MTLASLASLPPVASADEPLYRQVYERFRGAIAQGTLKPGDRICTIGGIYGTISRLKDDSVYIIAGADQKEMCLARWAIRSVEDAPLENDAEPLV